MGLPAVRGSFHPSLAYLASVWHLLIVVTLLMIPGYFDVALRNVGLALGALALAKLSHVFDRSTSELE